MRHYRSEQEHTALAASSQPSLHAHKKHRRAEEEQTSCNNTEPTHCSHNPMLLGASRPVRRRRVFCAHGQTSRQCTWFPVPQTAIDARFQGRVSLLRNARQRIRRLPPFNSLIRILCLSASGEVLWADGCYHPLDRFTCDSMRGKKGWATLGWVMADGSLPLGQLDTVDPALAQYGYLPLVDDRDCSFRQFGQKD
jgi:hypothetical protein